MCQDVGRTGAGKDSSKKPRRLEILLMKILTMVIPVVILK